MEEPAASVFPSLLAKNCFARDGGAPHPVYAEQREEVTADYARPKNPLIIPSLSLSHAQQQRERRYCVDNPLSFSPQRTSKEPNAICIKSLEPSQRSILDQKAFAQILTVSD